MTTRELAVFAAGFGSAAALWLALRDHRDGTDGDDSCSRAAGAAGASFLALSDADVRAALPMAEAIECNAAAFVALFDGSAVAPARHLLTAPEAFDGATLFKPSFVPGAGGNGGALGLKVVSVRPRNAARGLPTVPATVLLVDEQTGLLDAVMDATFLTALRTAAGSGAATNRLARADATALTVFGAGMQAAAHVDAVLAVRPGITRLWIINRGRARAAALAVACQARHPGLVEVEVGMLADVAVVEAAVRGADIICATTNASTPVFMGEWLAPGTHINAVGSYTPQMQELDVATVRQCAVVVDSEHALAAGDLAIAIEQEGPLPSPPAELGAVLAGKAVVSRASRVAPTGCTLFKSVGTAVQDVATAAAVLRAARVRGIGKHVAL